jgi:hypothetical protein
MPLTPSEREAKIWEAAEYIANRVEDLMIEDPVVNIVETLMVDLMDALGMPDHRDVHAFGHMIEQRIYAATAHKLTEPVELVDGDEYRAVPE